VAVISIKQIADHFQNEIRNTVLHKVSGSPGSPVEGQYWYDTATQKFKFRNASVTVDPTDRTQHTGLQTASTISDFTTAVQAIRWQTMQAPNADVNMGSQKIISVADPTTGTDGANKQYVDTALTTAVAGLSYKTPVEAATTGNIANLATGAPNTLDGVTLAAGNRILVKDQSTASQNGIYVVTTLGTGSNGVWTRATDADSSAELQGGVIVSVDQGSVNSDRMYMLATDVVTVGTTAQTWNQFGAQATYVGGAGLTLTGTTFDVGQGTGIVVGTDTISVDTTLVTRKYVGVVPSGSVDATINHALNVAWPTVQVYEISSKTLVQVGVAIKDNNNLVLSFGTAPTTNQYQVVVIG
jgi:hypothetical protein